MSSTASWSGNRMLTPSTVTAAARWGAPEEGASTDPARGLVVAGTGIAGGAVWVCTASRSCRATDCAATGAGSLRIPAASQLRVANEGAPGAK
jgi:hypothetical protein